jgi:endonuclease YncB( thermonuclease family)
VPEKFPAGAVLPHGQESRRSALPLIRAASIFLVLALPAGAAEPIIGRASVIDGDTIQINGERIRFNGRFVGTCFRADGYEVNRWLVETGNALDWPRYSKGAYAGAQDRAKTDHLGIWRGDFTEPCVARGERAKRKPSCYGIDAPESWQLCLDGDGGEYRCGKEAAFALDEWLAKSRPTRCEFVERDR